MLCHIIIIIILSPSTQKWSTKYYDCTAALRLGHAQCIVEFKISSSQKWFGIKQYYYVISMLTLRIFYLLFQDINSFFPHTMLHHLCLCGFIIFFIISSYTAQFLKKCIWHQMCLVFLYILYTHYYHSTKNSEWHYQKCT